MHPLILIALAVIPGLFLVLRYYSKDIYKKEPWAVIWKSFFWGAFSVIPAGLLETSLSLKNEVSIVNSLIENFLIVALTEELCKFAVIRFYSYRDSNFDEMMDGIVYGAAAAAGFATFENIFYVMENGFGTAVIRALLSVPAHILWGASTGYWMARVKFGQSSVLASLILGLGTSVLGHGFFDFALTSMKGYEFLALIPVILLSFFMSRFVKNSLEYDAVNVHKLSSEEIERINEMHSSEIKNAYLRKLLRAGSLLLGWGSVCTGILFAIGFYANYTDKGEAFDGTSAFLIIFPFAAAVFFQRKAAKYR